MNMFLFIILSPLILAFAKMLGAPISWWAVTLVPIVVWILALLVFALPVVMLVAALEFIS